MASYEQVTAEQIGGEIAGGGSDLLASILGATTGLAGASFVDGVLDSSVANPAFVGTDTAMTAEMLNSLPASVKVIQLTGTGADAGSTLNIPATSNVQAVLIGDSSGNNITFNGDKDALVSMGSGENNVVKTAAGNDVVNFGGGDNADTSASASINTGEGNDVVNIGGYGEVAVEAGAGSLVLNMMTSGVTATIDAGDGTDMMAMVGNPNGGNNIGLKANHDFVFQDGKFIMHSDSAVELQNLELIFWQPNGGTLSNVDMEADPWGLATGTTGALGASTFLADNANLGLLGKLYAVALGRSVLDGRDNIQPNGQDAFTGINFWTDYIDSTPNIDQQQLVYSFLDCNEFHNKTDGLSNAEYLNWLFSNMQLKIGDFVTGRDGNVHTYQEYLDQLNAAGDGFTNARMDVAWDMVDGKSGVEILGSDGLKYVIDASDFTDGNA